MITISIEDEEGNETEHELPSKKEVCEDCEGHGSVLNESMRHHAYTYEEFNEEFDDEGKEEYFKRGGAYDVPCPLCHGRNVVDVIDEEKLTPEQKVIVEEWGEHQSRIARIDAETRAYEKMERDFGC